MNTAISWVEKQGEILNDKNVTQWTPFSTIFCFAQLDNFCAVVICDSGNGWRLDLAANLLTLPLPAPRQYKIAKNFSNLYYHEQDFGIQAEWHFFATAHGKGPCDGVSRTVKRFAASSSLQLSPKSQITTPQKLYNWAKQNIPRIDFLFCPVEEYDLTAATLKPRFLKTKTNSGDAKTPRNFSWLEQKKVHQ